MYRKDVISYRVGKLEDPFKYQSLITQTDKENEAQRGVNGCSREGNQVTRAGLATWACSLGCSAQPVFLYSFRLMESSSNFSLEVVLQVNLRAPKSKF